MMKLNKLIKLSLSVIGVCLVGILLILFIPISQTLKEAIIAEVIGSGVLGVIVAGIFFYLQETNEYQANKSKALSFYENKLLMDISEVEERGPSIWNLSGLNKFYFDGSHINSLFDVYQNNFSPINDYIAYFPDSKLTIKYGEFYKLTRKGYVLGEKLENLIRQYIRAEHHKLNLISANDITMVMFLKGKLFANLSDSELIKHLEWNTVPERATQFLNQLNSDESIKKVVQDLRNTRILLTKLEKQVFKLAKKAN